MRATKQNPHGLAKEDANPKHNARCKVRNETTRLTRSGERLAIGTGRGMMMTTLTTVARLGTDERNKEDYVGSFPPECQQGRER